jgi:hypothetical protein
MKRYIQEHIYEIHAHGKEMEDMREAKKDMKVFQKR